MSPPLIRVTMAVYHPARQFGRASELLAAEPGVRPHRGQMARPGGNRFTVLMDVPGPAATGSRC